MCYHALYKFSFIIISICLLPRPFVTNVYFVSVMFGQIDLTMSSAVTADKALRPEETVLGGGKRWLGFNFYIVSIIVFKKYNFNREYL